METINGSTRATQYTYDADNRVTSVSTNGISESYSYDAYGRITSKVTKNGSATVLTEYYTYRTNSAGQPTSQVATMRSVSNGRDVTYTYDYDSNGNIISVGDGTHTTTYAYDSANQLVREDNPYAGESWTWTYDNGGNITTRTFYPYSSETLGSAKYAWNYGYNDSSWGDLLTDWWGYTFSYDSIGNLTHAGAASYTWEHGRQLASINAWSYTYDANGMRTGRTNGSRTYSYTYNGSLLSQMTVSGHTLYFTYDASGRPVSVTYDGTPYFYALNLQGDVVAILNSSGNTVVTYTYDAWGYERACGGSLKDTLGVHNPLRYRGYVYDPETKLYYLQSRYYDPELGRFINADILVSTGQGLLGNNMFAYCENSPSCLSDHTGFAPNKTTLPFVVIILDDGSGGGNNGGGGGVDPTLVLITILVRLWKTFNRFNMDYDTEEPHDAVFYTAYIDNGQIVQGTDPMNFTEAYNWVTTTATTYGFSYGASWGLYTLYEHDALEMAIALGGAEPVWDAARAGQYRHYHVYGRKLFTKYKHFHVWYGTPN